MTAVSCTHTDAAAGEGEVAGLVAPRGPRTLGDAITQGRTLSGSLGQDLGAPGEGEEGLPISGAPQDPAVQKNQEEQG